MAGLGENHKQPAFSYMSMNDQECHIYYVEKHKEGHKGLIFSSFVCVCVL